jgi:DNA-directed RNA polymerase subunit RPC12/RpoP
LVKKMNERRRLGERERGCVDCGETFTFKSTVAVRCPPCRRKRKIEQREALRVA